jgi:hypothetical protein
LYTRNLVCLAFRRDLFNEPNSTDRLVLLNRMRHLGAWQRSDFGYTPGADIESSGVEVLPHASAAITGPN